MLSDRLFDNVFIDGDNRMSDCELPENHRQKEKKIPDPQNFAQKLSKSNYTKNKEND